MAEQDFRNSAFYKELLVYSKEQGEISLIDIVSLMKKHKDTAFDLDSVIEALKDDGVQYTEDTEESEPDFMAEPSEEDLDDFSDDAASCSASLFHYASRIPFRRSREPGKED